MSNPSCHKQLTIRKISFVVFMLFFFGCATSPKAKNQTSPQAGYVKTGNLNNLNAQGETVFQQQSGTQNITNNYNGLNREQLIEELKSRDEKISKLQDETKELNRKTEFIDPFNQPLLAGTATVEVTIQSDAVSQNCLDRGGYIIFGKSGTAILEMASTTCSARQMGNNQVLYRGVFSLDATNHAIGKPISFLADADFVQIGFVTMPEKSTILQGKAICTFNNTVRIELAIPPQQQKGNYIIIPEANKAFNAGNKK